MLSPSGGATQGIDITGLSKRTRQHLGNARFELQRSVLALTDGGREEQIPSTLTVIGCLALGHA